MARFDFKATCEDIEDRARDNARTMVRGAIDDTREGIEAQRDSAASIIEDMCGELTDAQYRRLRDHFAAYYASILVHAK